MALNLALTLALTLTLTLTLTLVPTLTIARHEADLIEWQFRELMKREDRRGAFVRDASIDEEAVYPLQVER